MSDLRNFTDADGRRVQPLFAAFMLERGYDRSSHIFERDGHGGEYLQWNDKRWAEFEHENGYPFDYFRSSRMEEFIDWLSARVSQSDQPNPEG